MLQSFIQYIIEQERRIFGLSENDIETFLDGDGILLESTDIRPVLGKRLSAALNIPAPEISNIEQTKEFENPWQMLRAGAERYFNADKNAQRQFLDRARKLRGGMTTQDDSNPKLKKSNIFTNQEANAKLQKTGKAIKKYTITGLFLAPHTMSGVDVCPCHTAECAANCLGTESGRGGMESVKTARINKTKFAFEHPTEFFAMLDKDISKKKLAAQKAGKKLAVRLNGTSDIPWEKVARQMFDKHSDVLFFDYTKVAGRVARPDLPKNYHLTLSSNGINHPESNWESVRQVLDRGGNASMVFKVKPPRGNNPGGKLPDYVVDEATGKKYRVVNGDEHDMRPLDHAYNNIPEGEGVIAGLALKTPGGGWSDEILDKQGGFAVDVAPREHQSKGTAMMNPIVRKSVQAAIAKSV